jgi:hypothetical protein
MTRAGVHAGIETRIKFIKPINPADNDSSIDKLIDRFTLEFHSLALPNSERVGVMECGDDELNIEH